MVEWLQKGGHVDALDTNCYYYIRPWLVGACTWRRSCCSVVLSDSRVYGGLHFKSRALTKLSA